MSDARLFAPSASRNRAPILEALRPHLPRSGAVLEIASGTGEHVAHFAAALPELTWQPSDPEPERRASIDAWTANLPNVRPAHALDAASSDWPIERADAVLCIDLIHIAPWVVAEGLVTGAARILPPGGLLALYGPYRRRGQAMEPSNEASTRSACTEPGVFSRLMKLQRDDAAPSNSAASRPATPASSARPPASDSAPPRPDPARGARAQ